MSSGPDALFKDAVRSHVRSVRYQFMYAGETSQHASWYVASVHWLDIEPLHPDCRLHRPVDLPCEGGLIVQILV